MSDTRMSAFPHGLTDLGYNTIDPSPGMTLRDYFAGQALAAVYAESQRLNNNGCNVTEADIAEEAYSLADAMLRERES